MKKTLSIFIACILLAMASTSIYAEDTKTGTAKQGTPIVDGVIDEVWSSTDKYEIDRFKDGTETGLTSSFRALWDENNIYVLIDVSDKDHSFNGGPSSGDGVELYLNSLNIDTAAYDQDSVAYFSIIASDPENPAWDGSAEAKDLYAGTQKIAVTTTDSGFTYEISVNIKNVTSKSLSVGTAMGFDIQVNDQNDGSASRTGAYGWNDFENKAWETPAVLGLLTLEEGIIVEEAPAEEAPAEEAPATEDSATNSEKAPATADLSLLLSASALISGLGLAVLRKKKN